MSMYKPVDFEWNLYSTDQMVVNGTGSTHIVQKFQQSTSGNGTRWVGGPSVSNTSPWQDTYQTSFPMPSPSVQRVLTPIRLHTFLQWAIDGKLETLVNRTEDSATIYLWQKEDPRQKMSAEQCKKEDGDPIGDPNDVAENFKQYLEFMNNHNNNNFQTMQRHLHSHPPDSDVLLVYRTDVADSYIWSITNDQEFVVAILKDFQLQWKHAT